jgi:hypothetical protein
MNVPNFLPSGLRNITRPATRAEMRQRLEKLGRCPDAAHDRDEVYKPGRCGTCGDYAYAREAV